MRSSVEAEYVELRRRSVLERSRTSGAGWVLDPYRGCEWEDPFAAHRLARRVGSRALLAGGAPPQPGGCRQPGRGHVFIKTEAAAALRRQLGKGWVRGRSIAVGAGADPYQPAEKHFLVTRSLLEVLLEVRGLNLSIETRSPLIARDLDLLVELDRRHTVEVSIGLAALQPLLASRLEPLAPAPERRLRTVAKLAREGISTRLRCWPLLPGINTSEEVLRPLFAAARRAGARDVTGTLMTAGSTTRAWFFPWLEREFPEQMGRYRELFGWRDHPSPGQAQMILAPFRKLRLEMGFPRPLAGRG